MTHFIRDHQGLSLKESWPVYSSTHVMTWGGSDGNLNLILAYMALKRIDTNLLLGVYLPQQPSASWLYIPLTPTDLSNSCGGG
mmetsp:Transcript_42795/g.68707  ORF Transcript_42795/g.68707 Transcript_42795/m.68707 type:complete len:83 (+) Transcript_42795:214-462(+)